MSVLTGYIGTYASPRSQGVYAFSLNSDTGGLKSAGLYLEAPDSKYLCVKEGVMALAARKGNKAGVMRVDTRGPRPTLISEAYFEEQASCHVAQAQNRVYTANYHDGCVYVYDGGLALIKRISIAPKAGCHQVIDFKSHLLVPCLELDAVYVFDATDGYAPRFPLRFPSGSGPRHGVLSADGRALYILTERSNELFIYNVLPGPAFSLEGVSPLCVTGESAALRPSPCARYLYASTRGSNVITVFNSSGGVIQQVSSCGDHPRDIFVLDKWLLALNRLEGGLVSFPRDQATGRLGAPRSRCAVYEGICIAMS